MYLVKQIKDTIIDILLRVQGVTQVANTKNTIKVCVRIDSNKKRGLSAVQLDSLDGQPTLQSGINVGPIFIKFWYKSEKNQNFGLKLYFFWSKQAEFSLPYVYSRPDVYYFCQIFQALCLFPSLRLNPTLEYTGPVVGMA